MAEVGGVGGGPSGGPSGGSSAGGAGRSEGPSESSAAGSSSGAGTNSNAPDSAQESSSTIDRAEQAQMADTGAEASHEALSGDSAVSDPDSSGEVAAAQAEVAEVFEIEEARGVMAVYADELGDAIGQVEQTFSALDTQVARQTDFLANEAQMLTEAERAAALEFTAAEVAAAQEPFDAAIGAMIETTIEDPVMQAYVADLEPEEQKEFFEDMSRYMPASEVGREWSADFTDSLAELGATGQSAPLAEVAAEARAGLSPEDQVAFDAALGVLVGTGLAERPENADARLESAAVALGLPQSEVDAIANPSSASFEQLGTFTQTATSAFAAFDAFNAVDAPRDLLSDTATALTYADLGMTGLNALAEMAVNSPNAGGILGATQTGISRLSGVMSGAGRALGVVGLGFSVAATVDAIRQNNVTGAVSGGLGVAGAVGTMVAGAIGSGGLALAGYALIGAGLALPSVVDGLQNEAFVEGALAAALGPDPSSFSLRGRMIGTAPPGGAAMLDALRPQNMSIAEYLDLRIDPFNPDAAEFANDAWAAILDDFAALEDRRLEAAVAFQ